jgi:hypothetical protein
MTIVVSGLAIVFCFAGRLNDTLIENKKLQRIVDKIEKQESLLLNYELTPKGKRLAKKLSKHSTNDDLKLLTESNNPSVFCLAYLILAKRKDPSSESIYEHYKNMTEAEWASWDRSINRINRKHKSDVVLLYSKGNFLEDVHNKKKFLDLLD